MSSKKDSLVLGALGEKLGCQYLKQKGFVIVETNYRNRYGKRLGEIDIVAQQGQKIVFVEVKTRLVQSGEDILPEQNITHDKLHKLQKIAWCYLRERKKTESTYRFDALSVLFDPQSKIAKIRHLESIFLS